MIYCKVQNGVVVDRALFDAPMPSSWPDFSKWHESEEAQIGWSYSGGIFVPPDPDPVTLSPTWKLYKSTLIRRLTEAEATTLKAVLNAAPDKSQMLWAASEWLDSADPLFLTLKAAIAKVLGEKRAGEILAAE